MSLFPVLLALAMAMGSNPARGDDLDDFNRLLKKYCGGECKHEEVSLIAGYALSQEIRHAKGDQKARLRALAAEVQQDQRKKAKVRFEELSGGEHGEWLKWQ